MAENNFANAANDELGKPQRAPSPEDLSWPADPAVDEAAETWLIRIQSPSFSQSEEHEFFQWLESSPANQAAYLRAEALWHSLGHSPELDKRLNSPKARSKNWALWGSLATAATLAAVALLPSWGHLNGQQVETGTGEQLQISLTDGSRVQLNTQSSLNIEMHDDYRLLELEHGEVYFDVAHDPDRPLIVKINGAYVRVLGTRFNVFTDQHRSEVTVVEGSVDVSTDKTFSELSQLSYRSKQALSANQQVELNYLSSNNWLEELIGKVPASKRSEVSSVNSSDVMAWQRGEAIYNGSQLSEVINDLNRYYPGGIRLQDDALGQQTLVAALRLDDKEAALNTLASSMSLDIVKLANDEILLKAQRK